MTELRGASRHSLADVRQRVRDLPGDSSTLETVATELFAVAGLIDGQPTLRRALTDPSRSPDEREELIVGLLRTRVGDATQSVVVTGVRSQWSRMRDLADGIEHAGVLAAVRAAEEEDHLDDLEDELFRFARLVEGDTELLHALTDRAAPAARRADLVHSLLEAKATRPAVLLVEQAVVSPRGLSLPEALDTFGKVAAAWRERLVAIVRTAVPLTDADRERLTRTLSRQYGHEIHLNVLLDPAVIGGVRVELGNEVIDGTIASRLDDARRRLAG